MKLCLLMLVLSWVDVSAVTLHVSQETGDNQKDGLTPATALKTIQKAASMVNPGDTVIVGPGVYNETVQLTRPGTADQPITFTADVVERNRVIVSGADPAIRQKQVPWKLEDESLKLYSVPLAYAPARVLHEEIELYPYMSLDDLKTFMITKRGTFKPSPPSPGPKHGCAWENGRLYVRIHERYGSPDPAQHLMKVSPVHPAGSRTDDMTQPSDYNIGVMMTKPAHVIINGFTCETPGGSGIWIQYGNVIVKNCWFIGMRSGVRGWDKTEKKPEHISTEVTVERCEYHQMPMFDDMKEVVAIAETKTPEEQKSYGGFFWWIRKGGTYSQEVGLVSAAGSKWVIRNNYVHQTVDGLSFMAMSWSEKNDVYENHFARLIDNAIESENHAQDMRFHHNFIEDTMEAYSYQPLDGELFPSRFLVYNNVFINSAEMSAFWTKPIINWIPGSIKIKTPDNIPVEGKDRMVFFNNTTFYPRGDTLTLSGKAPGIAGFRFFNNITIADRFEVNPKAKEPSVFKGWEFANNMVAPATDGQPGPGAGFAGTNGLQFPTFAEIGLANPAGKDFSLSAKSSVAGKGITTPEFPEANADPGASPAGKTWKPPVVGPELGLKAGIP